MNISDKIKNYPISFFAIALGLIGFTLTFQRAEMILGFFKISNILLIITIIIFTIILLFYLMKIVFFFKDFLKELTHPIRINFFPLLAKILLVGSVVFLEINKTASKYLWIIGTILQLFFSIVIITYWINNTKYEINHLTPAWFIPIVGNVIIPIAGIVHFNKEISWFFFSVGIVFWLILFSLVMYRKIFHRPIADKLLPTMFILFAPTAIAFIAYTKLNNNNIDAFSRILYYFSIFMFILVIFQLPKFLKINFYLSWWAYSFPIAAISIATILYYHLTNLIFFKYFSFVLIGFFVIMIILLSIITIKNIIQSKICIEED